MPIKLSVFGKRMAHVTETTTGECDKFLAIRAPIPASHTSMGYSSAVLIVALAALAAALAAMAIQRFVGFDVRHQHHNAGSAVFLQLGVVFAVLLAFVFSEVWGEYNQAAAAIDLEVSAMHSVGVIAATLPAAQANTVLSKERAYLVSVVDREWPAMEAHRAEDSATDLKLQALLQEVANLNVVDDQRDKKAEMLSLLSAAQTQRETRIFQAGSGIPFALWLVLLAFTVTLALFVALSEIPNRMSAAVISACFAAGIASILVVAKLLDYPFEGALALPPDDFITVIGKVSKLFVS
jgi:Protein of unknown function (DUF4239)